jgi:adenylate cyclase
VGRDLGVGYVLEGSVRKAGDRLRITAQLVETENGHHLWAERYDRELSDIFALQDEVTRQIVAALEVRLSDAEQSEIDRVPTRNLEAYDLYQRALVYLGPGHRGPEVERTAEGLLRRAIDLDPDFGPAYAALAGSLVAGYMGHYSEDPDPLGSAEKLVDRALELDDTQLISLTTAASTYAYRDRREDALAAAQRAVALYPNSAAAHSALGAAMDTSSGSGDEFLEAMAELRHAWQLDPFAPFISFTYAGRLFYIREHEEAAAVLEQAIRKTPDFIGLHGMLAVVYAEMGRVEDAQAQGRQVLRINPNFSLEGLMERNVSGMPEDFQQRILAGASVAGLR